MANQNFVVQNGLTVGPLTIDAATGTITTSGNIVTTGTTVTFVNEVVTGTEAIYGNLTVANVTANATGGLNPGAVTFTGNIVPAGNVSYNIGSSAAWWNTLYGTSTHAQYADLAENYQADRFYNPGTVVMFGGVEEITLATAETTAVAGVVSTNPAHLMNGSLAGTNVIPLALTGRVPCMVIGPVAKGDMMVAAGFGYAKASSTPVLGSVIGKAVQDFPIQAKGVIEVVVGRL